MTTPSLCPPPATPALRFLAAHWALSRALGETLNPLLERDYDLELRAYLVLSSIYRGILYPTELADTLKLPKDTMSRTLQTLLKQGLIDKTIDPDDSRRTRLNISAAGEALLGQVRATLEKLLTPRLGALEPATLEAFLSTTETLSHDLTHHLGDHFVTLIPTR